MPAFEELFNKFAEPTGITVAPPVPPATAERAVVLSCKGLKLRKLDIDETMYDPMGKYYATTAMLPNWKADGLLDLFGFLVHEEFDPVTGSRGGVLGYQLSNDGGTTWYVWDSVTLAWVPAVGAFANVFSPAVTVDRWIPSFPFAIDRQVRVRVKLTPGTSGQKTPILRDVRLFGEMEIDLWEDMTRSLKRYVEQTMRISSFYLISLAGQDTILVNGDQGLVVNDPVKVYNLTTDPNRLVNVFSSRVGNEVRLSPPQTGQMEVRFKGSTECYIAAEDFLQISKIPSVVARVERLTHSGNIWADMPEADVSYARFIARRKPRREFFMGRVVLRCQSSLKREALQMTDTLHKILDRGQCFDSVAIGDCYCVVDSVSIAPSDQVPQGLFVGDLELNVFGRSWTTQTEEIDLVQKVRVLVGSDMFPHGKYREIMEVTNE